MPPAHNLALRTFEDASDLSAELGQPERADGHLTVVDTSALHARKLQNLLAEAYLEVPPEEKLPLGQRIAVVVGITSFLWAVIAAGVYAVL